MPAKELPYRWMMVSEGRMTWDDMVSSRLLLRVSFEVHFECFISSQGIQLDMLLYRIWLV